MKIITKYKDYYDYLQGVYGVDPLAVYDRRDAEIINIVFPKNNNYETLSEMEERLTSRKGLRGGRIYCAEYGVVVGDTLYSLGLEPTGKSGKDKYKREGIQMKFELIRKESIDRGDDKTPILLIYNVRRDFTGIHWRLWEKGKGKPYWNPNDVVKNPILNNTNFSSIVPPEEMFLKIQDFILANNEKPITDSRTDTQKLESAGFDKKTSFRNM